MSGEIIEFRNIADEITIRESDGVAIVSIKAAARLAGKEPKSLRHHFDLGGKESSSKLVEMLAAKGFYRGESKSFSETGIPDQALGVILKYYAYKAGRWCTEQAEHACDQFQEIGIRATCYAAKGLVEVKNIAPEPAPLTLPPAEKAKLAIEIVRDAFADLEFGNNPQQSNSLKAGILLSTAQEACPELASSLLPAQKFLAATNTVDAEDVVWLTPTSIGKRLGISAVKVNRLLKEMGLQISNHKAAKGEPSYLPTEKGQKYSRMTAATGGNGDMTTYQHLKWSERVLEIFDGGVAA
ncbi:hypothetical protein D0962_37040 [Leptolyngbyaceae cyanobacterium CCMR0082]|uniref:Antirepressor protein C-terminal domain-containing protein n=1 Tax=Adonisia turfae CCMR0082 TaxID=2304604 RepID=A0A6M0SIT9_9CYAN|nr:hypothetical protein [Adonisia turfae]NEZ68274.1 hypothetical protein [Adonisia turfae CCMR0082]